MRFLTPIFKHRFYLLLNSWWAIPCVFLMRVLKPIVFIRLGRIWSNRIGEFIAETSNLLANRKTQNFKSHDFIFYSDISNQQWASMVKRTHNVVHHWAKYIWYWNRFIPGGDYHSMVNDFTNHDRDGLLVKVPTYSLSNINSVTLSAIECSIYFLYESTSWKLMSYNRVFLMLYNFYSLY